MNDGSTLPHATLEDIYARAQADAQRMFGEGSAVPPPVAPARAGWWWAIPIVLGMLVLGWVFHALGGSDMPVARAAGDGRAIVERVDRMDEKPPSATTPAPVAAGASPGATLSIGRGRHGWRVDAVAASRLQAARQLAGVSGSTLRGATDLLVATRPLNLHWEGRSLSEAWHAVFGSELNYILNCPRQRCEVWILAGQALADVPPHGAPGSAAPARLGDARTDDRTDDRFDDRIDDRIDDGPRGDLGD